MADPIEILIVARDLASNTVKNAAGDIEGALKRVERASKGSASALDSNSSSQRRFSNEATSTERVLMHLASSVENLNRRLEAMDGSGGRGSGGLRKVADSGDAAWKSVAKLGAVLVGIPFLIDAVGGAAFGATAGVYALASALSTLVGFAVVLPAALGAVGGAAAALLGIAKPALGPVLSYVQQAGKQQASGAAAGGGSGTSQAQQVQQAERALQRTRQDNAYSMMQLERQLANARLQGVQQIIAAEQQLHALRVRDAAQEHQLELLAENARANLAGEQARGGANVGLAQAMVTETSGDVTRFRQSATVQEHQAQQNVQQQVQQRNYQVQSVQIQIQRQQVLNARSLADAQRNLAQAQQGSAGATSALSQAYQHLTPLQRQVANQVLALKDHWKALTAGDQVKWLEEVSRWLTLIDQHLPAIAGEVEKFSNALLGASADGRKAFDDPALTAAWGRVDTVLARGLRMAGDTAISLGKAMIFVLDAARPFLRWIEDTVAAWGQYIEKSARVNDRNGDLARFFEHARHVGTEVGHIVANLAIAFFNIGKIAFPTGTGLLGSLETLSKRFRNFTESAGGRQSIANFFKDWTPVLRQLGTLLGNVASDLKNMIQFMGPSPVLLFLGAINKLPGPLQGVVAFLGLMVWGLSRIGLGGVMGGAIEGLAKFLGSLALSAVGLGVFDGLLIGADGLMLGFGETAVLISLPVLGIAAAIALLVVGILLLLNHFGLLQPVLHAAGVAFGWVWDQVKSFLGWLVTHWKGIIEIILGPLGLLIVEVKQHWGTISGIISDAVHGILSVVKSVFGAILDFFTHGTGGQITGAIVSVFHSAVSGAKTAWNDLMTIIGEGVNGVIHGINWVLRQIGLGHDQIEDWKPPLIGTQGGAPAGGGGGAGRKVARGGGGLPQFAEGGVVPGPVGSPQLVVAHGGEEFLGIGSHKRGIGGGLGGGGSSGGSPTNGILGDALGWIGDHLPHLPSLSRFGPLGNMVSGAFDWMRGKALGWLEGKAKAGISFITGIPGDIASLFTRGGSLAGAETSRARQLGAAATGVRNAESPLIAKQIAALLSNAMGWSLADFAALVNLWTRESGWSWWAENPSSGAYGIPQSLPASKLASAGADWRTNPFTQIMWGLAYIKSRYGDPLHAWAHETAIGWYDRGGMIGGAPFGTAVPIVAHAGEWVLNQAQQMKLAQILGGLENVKALLFSGVQTPTYSFAGGGVVQNLHAMNSDWSQRQSVYAPVTVYSSKAEYDGDYLAAVIERRMEMGG